MTYPRQYSLIAGDYILDFCYPYYILINGWQEEFSIFVEPSGEGY